MSLEDEPSSEPLQISAKLLTCVTASARPDFSYLTFDELRADCRELSPKVADSQYR
jgi:hypothetical protein